MPRTIRQYGHWPHSWKHHLSEWQFLAHGDDWSFRVANWWIFSAHVWNFPYILYGQLPMFYSSPRTWHQVGHYLCTQVKTTMGQYFLFTCTVESHLLPQLRMCFYVSLSHAIHKYKYVIYLLATLMHIPLFYSMLFTTMVHEYSKVFSYL